MSSLKIYTNGGKISITFPGDGWTSTVGETVLPATARKLAQQLIEAADQAEVKAREEIRRKIGDKHLQIARLYEEIRELENQGVAQ